MNNLLLICTAVFLGCSKQTNDHGLTDYLNRNTVSDFAPELCLKDNTYKGSFSDDYKTFYFFRKKSPELEKYIPYQSNYINGKWYEAKIPDYYDNKSSYTYQLKIPHSEQLVFLSDKRIESDTSQIPNYNFWLINSTENASSPRELGYQSLIYNYNSQPCISKNGTIYFTSDEPDWSATHSYKMKRVENGYDEPELFEPVNRWRDQYEDWTVYEFCMAPNEDYMIVCIEDNSYINPSVDLYISYFKDSEWSIPEKLGNGINTTATENFPVITADGNFLIFTRGFSEFKIIPINALLGPNEIM
ncbi:MAG: hypothetical protein DHS20C09_05680 [marine bacterium B5-7]|nr:MAG: hypothetical protein DHS20C09_05680 [marine bacterium B5-7]